MTARVIGETAADTALTPAERLVLWSVRTWFVGAYAGTPVLTVIAAAFQQAMAVSAIPALDTAMTLVAAGGQGLSIHSPRCPALGDSERLLLDLLALHQTGEMATALFLTRSLLPPAAARLAGPALRALAMELLACGLRIPDRRGLPVPGPHPSPAPYRLSSSTVH